MRTTPKKPKPSSKTGLQPGCYLISFRPHHHGNSSTVYVGTLRVTKNAKDCPDPLSASGDLYEISSVEQIDSNQKMVFSNVAGLRTVALGKLDGTVPIFPVDAYRYYLDIHRVSLNNGIVLDLQAHKFDPDNRRLNPGSFRQLRLTPDSSIKGQQNFTGELFGSKGKAGDFYLQFLGRNLRRASLRIFTLQGSEKEPIEFPGARACSQNSNDRPGTRTQKNWQDAFQKFGWDLDVQTQAAPASKVAAPATGQWGGYDLGMSAARLRDDVSPNGWTYDLLCVSRFHDANYLGMMFDGEATDLNQRPRESAAVAALQEWTLTDENGTSKTQTFQKVRDGNLYFRTALHEVGHCLNLTHSLTTNTVMDTTDGLFAKNGPALNGAADRIFEFAPDDVFWMQHAPDIAIRPGGVSRHKLRWQRRRGAGTTTVIIQSMPGLTLSILPVDPEIPFGAPARLDYKVSNQGSNTSVPFDISLRGGYISGTVTGPDQTARFFRSAFKCCDSLKPDGQLVSLPQGATTDEEGMTVLRGIDGPLFPLPGIYRIELALRWDHLGLTRQVVGETSIAVLPPDSNDPEQSVAAAVALNQPLLMPAIVQGRLEGDGVSALRSVMDSKTLAPHYLATTVRCLARGGRNGLGVDDWIGQIRNALGNGRRRGARNTNTSRLTREEFNSIRICARVTCRESKQLDQLIKSLQLPQPQSARTNPTSGLLKP